MIPGLPERAVFADFVDGAHARLQRVSVRPRAGTAGGALEIGLPEGDVQIWPLEELREVPDQAVRQGIVLARAGGDPARLYLDDPAIAAALRAHCPELNRVTWSRPLLRRLGGLAAGALAAVALIVFVLIPFMADRLAMLMPSRGEQALGAATFEQVRNALGQGRGPVPVCRQPEGLAALERMTARLVGDRSYPYPLEVQVLRHPMINAFALPGGYIILFDGLLRDAGSAEAVAGVLAHEIGHVAARDPTRLALRSAGSVGVLGLLFGDFAGGAFILLLTEHLIRASYSRQAEADADAYAAAMLAEAGLPAAPLAAFLRRLAADDREATALSHFATHPDPRARAEATEAADTIGETPFKPVLTPREWEALRTVCGFDPLR